MPSFEQSSKKEQEEEGNNAKMSGKIKYLYA